MRKRLLSLLCLVCVLISFTGCTIGDHEVFFTGGAGMHNIFRIGDLKCPREEYCVYLATYRNLFDTVGDSSIWSEGFETDTIYDSLKKNVVSHLTKVYALNIYATEQEVELTENEETLAKKAAEEFYGGLSKTDRKKLKVSQGDIEEMYLRYALAEKVYFALMNQVDDEVSEDEARVMDAYVLYTTKEDTANYVSQALSSGTGFMNLLNLYGTGNKGLQSISRGMMPQEVEKVIFSMEDNQVSECITTEDGYYFVYCVSKYNAELSESNKANVVEKRKAQVVSDIISEQNKNYYSELNEKLLEKTDVDASVETRNFFTVLDSYINFK